MLDFPLTINFMCHIPEGADIGPVTRLVARPLARWQEKDDECHREYQDDIDRDLEKYSRILWRYREVGRLLPRDRDVRQWFGELVHLASQLPGKDPGTRLFLDTYTPEAMVETMEACDDHAGIIAANGFELLHGVIGQYTRNYMTLRRLAPSEDRTIAHCRGRPPEGDLYGYFMEYPHLSRFVGVDPRTFACATRERIHGWVGALLDTFLHVVVPACPDRTALAAGMATVPEDARAPFDDLLRRLLPAPSCPDTRGRGRHEVPPTALALSRPAATLLESFGTGLWKLANGNGCLAGWRDWASSLRFSTTRIAALLHLCDGDDTEIPEEDMARAIRLARHLIGHFTAAHGPGKASATPCPAGAEEEAAWRKKTSGAGDGPAGRRAARKASGSASGGPCMACCPTCPKTGSGRCPGQWLPAWTALPTHGSCAPSSARFPAPDPSPGSWSNCPAGTDGRSLWPGCGNSRGGGRQPFEEPSGNPALVRFSLFRVMTCTIRSNMGSKGKRRGHKSPEETTIYVSTIRVTQKNGWKHVYRVKSVYDPTIQNNKRIASRLIGKLPPGEDDLSKMVETRKKRPASPADACPCGEPPDDARQPAQAVWPLDATVAALLLATLAGRTTCEEGAGFWKANRPLLSRLEGFPGRDPSPDEVRRLVTAIGRIGKGDLLRRLAAAVRSLRAEAPAAGGDPDVPAAGGAADSPRQAPALLAEAGSMTVELAPGEARGKDPDHVAELFRKMDIAGAVVTCDALPTQAKLAKNLVERGADFCLALANPQTALFDVAAGLFAEGRPEEAVEEETTTLEDGSRLQRRIRVLPGRLVDRKSVLGRWPWLPGGCLVEESILRIGAGSSEAARGETRLHACSLHFEREHVARRAMDLIVRHGKRAKGRRGLCHITFDREQAACRNAGYLLGRTLLDRVAAHVLSRLRQEERARTGKAPASRRAWTARLGSADLAIRSLAALYGHAKE